MLDDGERLLDEALGPGWSVLCPDGRAVPPDSGHRVVRVTPELDPSGRLRRWLRGRTVVLRPDRVVHATR
jgi:3-(3-hydroxy-phenyl)propionate hydroxylase